MKIMANLSESFIDVWNEEKEIWERYAKVSLVPEEQKKIPEKLEAYCLDEEGEYPINPTIYEGILKNKINEIIDYLKSKGE